jgi:N utilization substance protein A
VRLFETEIPEIQEGIVLVKAAAREPGERAKVAVASTKRDVDPIGACVGLRGTRIQVISRELRGEKIDIIEWSSDPITFVARALSPAKVSSVEVADDPVDEGAAPVQPSALVIVPDNQLSLAIGKKGQNARLAAKLTGMRIDIKSESEALAEQAGPDDGSIAGLVALGSVTPAQLMALQAAGIHSVDGLVAAGPDRLREIPDVAAEADELVAAAERWLAARDREPEAAPSATADGRDVHDASGSGETPAA